jgi:tRNA threonylcarbamoyladenosine biosynthesis protein TsaE
MEIVISDLKHLHESARKFILNTDGRKIFAFSGSMGAGKTTIIKAICEVLGAKDIVTSPTFTIVNEYRTYSGESIYHIDFYRIKKSEEVFDFGIEEYFDSGSYCFMEWPELVEGILPPETVNVKISVDEKERRIIQFSEIPF